jgi:Cu2+-exporting ATPase
MVVQFGILVTAYIGVKLYDSYKNKQTLSKKKLKLTPESRKILAKKSNIDAPEKVYDRYFKVSIVSLGLAVWAAVWAPTAPLLYVVTMGTIIYTSIPIMKLGERQLLKRRTVGHDVLFTLYIILTFLTHQELYLTIGVFFYHAGSKVLALNQALSKPIITSLIKQQPDTVWVLKEGTEIEVPLADVIVDDIVVIRAGEVVPIDGTIIEGMAMIDQHALTGEAQPVEKETDEQIFSSTLIVSGQIQVKVTKAGHETTISKIAEILNNTAAYTTAIQSKGERWANLIAMPIVGLALLVIPTQGLLAATAVVHSTFGNRLRVLAPLGTLNYLHAAFGYGLLIKDGRAIEELNQVDTVLFDKTGTLTHEQPEVGRIISCHDDYSSNDILTYAATAERKLSHPLAYAILKKAEESNLVLPSLEDSKYHMGYGITVNIDNQVIRVGSARFMEMENMIIPEILKTAIKSSHLEGHSLVLVAINTEVAGAIEIESTLRPEVKAILAGLRQRGIKHIAIVSGDHKYPTQKLAESLGMDSYFYEVLPRQKAEIVKQLQQQGRKVCFVGDGINDAIAMKTANVSVSLRGATAIATDSAQAVLMDGSLSHLCDLFDISHKLKNNLRRTLIFLIVPSAMSLGGALFLGLRLFGSVVITYTGFTIALGNAMLPNLQQKYRQRAGKD